MYWGKRGHNKMTLTTVKSETRHTCYKSVTNDTYQNTLSFPTKTSYHFVNNFELHIYI